MYEFAVDKIGAVRSASCIDNMHAAQEGIRTMKLICHALPG